jgi:hypothetical protein
MPYLSLNIPKHEPQALSENRYFFSERRGCVKSIPPPTAAKESFEQTLFVQNILLTAQAAKEYSGGL